MAYFNDPQSLGEVLKELIERMGLQNKINEVRVVEMWASIAGPQINGVTDSAWVRGKTLYVKLTSSVWRQELHLRRNAWKQRLNAQIGEELIEEIVFR